MMKLDRRSFFKTCLGAVAAIAVTAIPVFSKDAVAEAVEPIQAKAAKPEDGSGKFIPEMWSEKLLQEWYTWK
jgi:hypothetical protein